MPFNVVIPARMASRRLPGKPLVDLLGRPLILHVCEKAQASGADRIVVATDDSRIRDVCEASGYQVEITSASHESGTDRIAEVVQRLRWYDGEIVVNLQGDEPLMPPQLIRQVAQLLDTGTEATVATLCTPIHSADEFLNPNVVKIVTDREGAALYFSRAPIPWNRDGVVSEGSGWRQSGQVAFRHIGLYAYRVAALKKLAISLPCALEQLEKLEQIRILWLGMKIAVDVAREVPGPSVDTAADLEHVVRLLQNLQ